MKPFTADIYNNHVDIYITNIHVIKPIK